MATYITGLPGGANSKESTCQCKKLKKHVLDPLVGKMPWNKKWQPTPVFLPGESHGQKSLVSYSPWGRKELDTSEVLSTEHIYITQSLIYTPEINTAF